VNILTQLISTFMFLVVIASVSFVILPPDSCKRVDRLTTITYGALGLIPWVGESIIKADMTKRWHDAETMTEFVHTKIADYFEIHSCSEPSFRPWGVRSKETESLQWMQEQDPELFQHLQSQKQ